VDTTILDVGCCGLAGSFAYKPGDSGVARRIAEEQWLPRLRAGTADRLLVMDGFSRQLQAQQTSPELAAHAFSLTKLLWDLRKVEIRGQAVDVGVRP